MPVQTGRQITVRRLMPEDQPLLEEMYSTFEPMGAALGLPPRDAARRATWLAGLREGINLVAFAAGKLVGHLVLLSLGETAEMSAFVHQDFRRQGIGTAMVFAAVEQGRAAGYTRLVVFIDTRNRAARQGLLKFGFRATWEDLQEAEYGYRLVP